MEQEPECFERSHPFGHLTASAWVVNAAGDEVVLLHHKKLDRWLQPGGHADGDPDVLGVALREVAEETGLVDLSLAVEGIFDIDIHAIPARPRRFGTLAPPEGTHFHFDVRYALRAGPGAELIPNHESHAVRWIKLREVGHMSSSPSVLRMVEKWIAAKKG